MQAVLCIVYIEITATLACATGIMASKLADHNMVQESELAAGLAKNLTLHVSTTGGKWD